MYLAMVAAPGARAQAAAHEQEVYLELGGAGLVYSLNGERELNFRGAFTPVDNSREVHAWLGRAVG